MPSQNELSARANPLELVVAGFSIAIALFYVAIATPGLEREPQEWLYWGMLAFGYPLLLTLLVCGFFTRIRLWLIAACVIHLGYALFTSAVIFFPKLMGRYPASGLDFFICGISVGISASALAFLARWLLRNFFLFSKETPSTRAVILLAAVLGCLFRNGEHPVGFPLFYWRHLIDFVVFGLFGWFSWKVFFGDTAAPEGQISKGISWFWYLLFALWGMQPINQPSWVSLHHWSYYAGPIELIRNGGRFLYDVPSQYGFLSLLFPAALPFSALTSVQLSVACVLFFQALILYRALLALPLKRHREIWAGLVAMSFVYWLPGDHNELGALTYPNTSAYRFFPAFLTALFLSGSDIKWLSLGKRRLALASAFGVGCFWSLESAVFCIGAWGYAMAAEGALLGRTRSTSNRAKEFLKNYATPWGGVAAIFAGTEIWYRLRYGLPPDWRGYWEYSKIYSDSFALSPITPQSALNLALILLAAVGTFLIAEIRHNPQKEVPGRFAFWGIIIATFTYFVARSEPINVITLLGIWLPCFFQILAFSFSQTSVVWKRHLVLMAFLITVIFVPFSIPNPTKKTLGNSARGWARFFGLPSKMIVVKPETTAIATAHDLSLPLANLTLMKFPIPPVSTPTFALVPWLPGHPFEHFCHLPSARRAQYLERFLVHAAERAQLVREESSQEPCAMQTWKVINRYYIRESGVPIAPNLILETYRLRSKSTDPPSSPVTPRL